MPDILGPGEAELEDEQTWLAEMESVALPRGPRPQESTPALLPAHTLPTELPVEVVERWAIDESAVEVDGPAGPARPACEVWRGFSSEVFPRQKGKRSLDLTSPLEIQAWVWFGGSGHEPVFQWEEELAANAIQLRRHASGKLQIQVTRAGKHAYAWSPIGSRRWHHVAASVQPDLLRLFVNGTEVARQGGNFDALQFSPRSGVFRIGAATIIGVRRLDLMRGAIAAFSVRYERSEDAELQRIYESTRSFFLGGATGGQAIGEDAETRRMEKRRQQFHKLISRARQRVLGVARVTRQRAPDAPGPDARTAAAAAPTPSTAAPPLQLAKGRLAYVTLYRAARAAGVDYEANIRRAYEVVLAAGDVALDVGAHSGKHAIPMARCVGAQGHVHAFEPLPEAYEKLVAGLRDAKVSERVTTYRLAVADVKMDDAEFFAVENRPGQSGLKQRERYAKKEWRPVPTRVKTTTLDEVLGSTDKIRFVKLDAEGAEFPILRGGVAMLRKNRPVVHFEFGPESYRPYGTTPEDVWHFFTSNEYLLLDILGRRLPNLEEFVESDRVASLYDYLAVPREYPDLDRLRIALIDGWL